MVASNGFLAFPAGQFTSDPNGAFVQDGTSYHSTARPYLYGGGQGSATYDWALRRWVPVRQRSVSPDGAHYAYESGFGAIHDVDVSTGADHPLKGPEGPDTVIYYAKEGIYFNHAWEGPPGPGLWLMDATSGAVQTVISDRPVDNVGGFAAWITEVNPADPHPVFSQLTGGSMPNQVLRRDLNGGPTGPWFYRPGQSVAVVGFDADKKPLIAVESGSSPGVVEIWQVPAANQGRKLYAGPQLPTFGADSHGIWFADQQGQWLYTPASGLQKWSSLPADIAGPCL